MPARPRILGLLLLAIALLAPIARAESGDELSVYVMTLGPGDEIFEKFGHNLLRIVDHSTGDDIVYNWGLFDFNQPNFFINFARGAPRYWMESDPYDAVENFYEKQDRSIWLQELNLSPAQKLLLRNLCRQNDTDAARFYTYNYFNDNCSTRVRDTLDKATGGQIQAQLSPQPTGTTYRWHTRRLSRENLAWYLMLDTALGPATDRPISKWEESFLPVKFSGYLDHLTIKDSTGQSIPLVKSTQQVYQSKRPPEPTEPPTWWPWMLLIGAIAAGGLIGLERFATRNRAGRFIFGAAATLYTLALGLCGLIGLGFWLFTNHWATWRNENLFEYSPLALPLACLIPFLFKNRPRIRKIALRLAIAIAVSTLIGLLLSPMLPQSIADPMALVLPINLALAWTVWNYVRLKKDNAKVVIDEC